MIVYLTVDQAIKIHERMVEQHGGLKGIRDLGLLTSAMEMPKSAYGGHELHPSLFDKAAAYLFHIVKNHPFFDGNKRTSTFVAVLFLRLNGISITFDKEQFEILVIGTAQGIISKSQISHFFEESSAKIIRKKSKHLKRKQSKSK